MTRLGYTPEHVRSCAASAPVHAVGEATPRLRAGPPRRTASSCPPGRRCTPHRLLLPALPPLHAPHSLMERHAGRPLEDIYVELIRKADGRPAA